MAAVPIVVVPHEVLADARSQAVSIQAMIEQLSHSEWTAGHVTGTAGAVRAVLPSAEVFPQVYDCAWAETDTQAHGWGDLLSGIPLLRSQGFHVFDPIEYDEVLSGEALMERWGETNPEPWDADRFRDAVKDIEAAIRSHPNFETSMLVLSAPSYRVNLEFKTQEEVGGLVLTKPARAAGDEFQFWTRLAGRDLWKSALAADFAGKDEASGLSVADNPVWLFNRELHAAVHSHHLDFEYGDNLDTVRAKCAQAIAIANALLDRAGRDLERGRPGT